MFGESFWKPGTIHLHRFVLGNSHATEKFTAGAPGAAAGVEDWSTSRCNVHPHQVYLLCVFVSPPCALYESFIYIYVYIIIYFYIIISSPSSSVSPPCSVYYYYYYDMIIIILIYQES